MAGGDYGPTAGIAHLGIVGKERRKRHLLSPRPKKRKVKGEIKKGQARGRKTQGGFRLVSLREQEEGRKKVKSRPR